MLSYTELTLNAQVHTRNNTLKYNRNFFLRDIRQQHFTSAQILKKGARGSIINIQYALQLQQRKVANTLANQPFCEASTFKETASDGHLRQRSSKMVP